MILSNAQPKIIEQRIGSQTTIIISYECIFLLIKFSNFFHIRKIAARLLTRFVIGNLLNRFKENIVNILLYTGVY